MLEQLVSSWQSCLARLWNILGPDASQQTGSGHRTGPHVTGPHLGPSFCSLTIAAVSFASMATAVGCSLSHTFPPVLDCISWPMKQNKPSSIMAFLSGMLSGLQERPLVDLPSRAITFRYVMCSCMFVNTIFNTREGSPPEQAQARMIQEAFFSHYNLMGSVSVNLKGNANGKQQR